MLHGNRLKKMQVQRTLFFLPICFFESCAVSIFALEIWCVMLSHFIGLCSVTIVILAMISLNEGQTIGKVELVRLQLILNARENSGPDFWPRIDGNHCWEGPLQRQDLAGPLGDLSGMEKCFYIELLQINYQVTR